MSTPNAVHHLAVSTGNMKAQIQFFSDVLGMELQGLFWMHGVEGAWHAFMKLGAASMSFVFIPGNDKIEPVMGVSHAGNGGESSAPGTTQHIAFNVDSMAEMLALRDRIRSRGVPAFGPIHHGICSSIYFAGPENLSLDIAKSAEAVDPLDGDGTWIDQEVVAEAGISPEELAAFMRPEPFEAGPAPVAQPAYDPDKPHMVHPRPVYDAMLAAPDEAITAAASVTTPPNPRSPS
jgi:catechol 2,3-dioxygenase-like lactoylglutathione lyase family enzyme